MIDEWKKLDVIGKFEFLLDADLPVEAINAWVATLTEEEYQTIREHAVEKAKDARSSNRKMFAVTHLSWGEIDKRIKEAQLIRKHGPGDGEVE